MRVSSISFVPLKVFIISLLCVFAANLYATRPPSLPYDLRRSEFQSGIPNRLPDGFRRLPMRDLDNYIGQMQLAASFLDSMQEHDPESNDFGGLHEGESDQLWALVETDNTQEAIRVWCEYAVYFEDTDTYRENIEDAWTYAENYPAWEEDHPDSMYAIHNSGWGLIAEIMYRQVYGDDKREYGLQCADHLVEHAPRIEEDNVHPILPLVAGWTAGTLYDYGLLEENEEYIGAAVELGEHVKAWLDNDPNRLNSYENWALCGGIAMWGVLRSLGKSDSAATADWAQDILAEMDVFAGRGNWDNSWNIWYAHAWTEAFKLTGEQAYRENAIAIVDSLINQDTDGDGGIQATTGDPDDRDQSWVTAYTAWMGYTNLFQALQPIDIELVSVISPSLSRPWAAGEPINLAFEFVQAGSEESVNVPLNLTGPVDYDTLIAVNGWQPTSWQVSRSWIPENSGEFTFTVYSDHAEESDRSNDSLHFNLNILPVGDVFLSTTAINDDPVHAVFLFYNLDVIPDSVFKQFATDSLDGTAESELMVGNYRVDVIPDFPYARQYYDNIEITNDQINTVELELEHPSVLLVDNDSDSTHADYYKEALNRRGFSFYRWHTESQGEIAGKSGGFQTLVYFTGDRYEQTIPPDDRSEIIANLEGGRNLFLTGQYIADEFQNHSFLSDVLNTQYLASDVPMAMVEGVAGDEVFDDMSMLLLGARGANNQAAPSGIWAMEGAQTCLTYRNKPDTGAAVRWELENGARGMFFGFGFEGISEQAGNTRSEVMTTVLDWMNTPHGVKDVLESVLPVSLITGAAFPNPANGMVSIKLDVPISGNFVFNVYNSRGRYLTSIKPLKDGIISWNSTDIMGNKVPSGVYYFITLNRTGRQLSEAIPVAIVR